MKQSAPSGHLPVSLGRSAGFFLNRGLYAGLACFFLLLLCGHVNLAAAAEFSVGAGGNMSTTPYKDYDLQWTPLPLISFENDYLYIRGNTAGVKLLNLKFLEFSVYGGYDDTSFDASESSDRRLQSLDNRHPSAVAGMEARLLTPYGMLHTSAARDVLGNSEGWSGSIGYAYSVESGGLEIIATGGLSWASGRYNDYYYGVSAKETQKSGLHSYKAHAGFSPYLGLTLDYSLTDDWEIFCNGRVTFLSNTIQGSPMVDKRHTWSATAGIMYNF